MEIIIKMNYNLKIILYSEKSMTNISLAISKIILLLDECNNKCKDKVDITTLSVDTNKSVLNYGEIILLLSIKTIDFKVKFFRFLDNLINQISKNYRVKIKKIISEV